MQERASEKGARFCFGSEGLGVTARQLVPPAKAGSGSARGERTQHSAPKEGAECWAMIFCPAKAGLGSACCDQRWFSSTRSEECRLNGCLHPCYDWLFRPAERDFVRAAISGGLSAAVSSANRQSEANRPTRGFRFGNNRNFSQVVTDSIPEKAETEFKAQPIFNGLSRHEIGEAARKRRPTNQLADFPKLGRVARRLFYAA